MLNILANDKPLKLKASSELTIKEKNPLFESDITGTAYPISVPAKPNMVPLAFQHRPGAPLQDLPVTLEYGSLHKHLIGVITKASPERFELSMKLDDSGFFLENDKTLQEVPFDETFLLSDVINNYMDYVDHDSGKKFCIPELYNEHFFEGLSLSQSYNNYQNKIYNTTKAEERPITPFFYLREVIHQIVKNAGYTIVDSPFYDEFFKTIFIYSNTSVYNYGSPTDSDIQIIPGKHLPAVTTKEFFKSITALFNLTPVFDLTERTVRFFDFDKLLVEAFAEDLTDYAISNFDLQGLEKTEKIVYKHEFDGNDDVVIFEEDQKYDDTVANFSDLDGLSLPPGSRVLVSNEDYIYVFVENEDYTTEWKKYSINYPIIELGNKNSSESKEYTSGFSSLASKYLINQPNSCYTGYKGNTQARAENIEHPSRLGIIEPRPVSQPFALVKSTNPDATLSLQTGYESKAINKRFTKTFDFYINGYRPAEILLKLPPKKLFDFDFTRKYSVRGVQFIVEELNYKLTNNGIEYSPAKVRLL